MDSQIKLRPKPEVANDFRTTTRTIDRWIRDPKMGFPAPVRINSRCYFDAAALELWKAERLRTLVAQA